MHHYKKQFLEDVMRVKENNENFTRQQSLKKDGLDKSIKKFERSLNSIFLKTDITLEKCDLKDLENIDFNNKIYQPNIVSEDSPCFIISLFERCIYLIPTINSNHDEKLQSLIFTAFCHNRSNEKELVDVGSFLVSESEIEISTPNLRSYKSLNDEIFYHSMAPCLLPISLTENS